MAHLPAAFGARRAQHHGRAEEQRLLGVAAVLQQPIGIEAGHALIAVGGGIAVAGPDGAGTLPTIRGKRVLDVLRAAELPVKVAVQPGFGVQPAGRARAVAGPCRRKPVDQRQKRRAVLFRTLKFMGHVSPFAGRTGKRRQDVRAHFVDDAFGRAP